MKRFGVLFVLAVGVSAVAFAQNQADDPAPAAPASPVVPEEAATDPAEALEAAYRKEFAFLEAQRRSLEQRLADSRQTNQQALAQARQRLQELEAEVVRRTNESDRLDELVAESELQVQANADASDVLEATFIQAGVTLEDYGIDRLDTAQFQEQDDASKVTETFALGLELMEKVGSVYREQGSYFLADGTEVNGDILRIGNIAAFGSSPRGSGALAPAGGGRFKVWGDHGQATAEALFSGQNPNILDVFLFESLTNAVERKPEKTVLEVINSGGAIGWVIVALGLLAVLLITLRIVFLRSASSATATLSEQVAEKVRGGHIQQGLEICRNARGATSRVLAAALRNLDRDREHLEDIVSEAILHEHPHLNRFGTFILVIAAVAPLLGLLGTVTGMISTFDVITEFGTGDPKLLAGGIAIALVTTELGLIVAIPTLLIGNLLSGWAESIETGMETSALKIINIDQDRRGDRLRAA